MGVTPLYSDHQKTFVGGKGRKFMIKKIIRRIISGFFIGAAAGNIICILTSSLSEGSTVLFSYDLVLKAGSEQKAFILQFLLSGLFGAVAMAGTIFYEIDSKFWNLAAASFAHYLIITAAFIPIAYTLCWVTTLNDILIMTGILFVSQFIVCVIINLIYKAQVKELNKIFKEKHK